MKKLVSLVLVLLLVCSIFAISASAEQVEVGQAAADDAVVAQGADAPAADGADSGADSGAGNTITFEVETAGWKNYNNVFCHLWEYGSDAFYSWQSKAEKCAKNADGTWSYDLDKAKISLDGAKQYCVIFSNDLGMQTYNLLLGSACIGDKAYCDGTTYENPEDSNKTAQAAFWRGQDKTKFGPELAISSIGTVVGTCCPASTSPYQMFVKFLQEKLENARTFSKKDDQTLLDDTAAALSLKQDDVEAAIKESGVSVKWDKSKSTLPAGKNEEAHKKGDGSDDNSGGSSSGGSSDSSGSADSGSSGSSGSSGASGSASASTTGQDTTVLWIMLGVLLAAAAVIIVLKKRNKA